MRSKSNNSHYGIAPSIAIHLDDGVVEHYDEKRYIYKSRKWDQCKIAKVLISAIISMWIIIVFYQVTGPKNTFPETIPSPIIHEDVFKTWVQRVKETGYGPSPIAPAPVPPALRTHTTVQEENDQDFGLSDDEIEQWDLQAANSNTKSNIISDDDDELDGFQHHHTSQDDGLYIVPSAGDNTLPQDQEVLIEIIPPQRLPQDEYGNDVEM